MSFGSEFGPTERLGAQEATPEIQTDGWAPVDGHRRKSENVVPQLLGRA